MKLLQTFVQNTAHEIRTPLTLISLNVGRMSTFDGAEQRSMRAVEVEKQIQRITQLLDVSLIMLALESPEIETSAVIDVAALLREIGERVAEQYEMVIRYEIPDRLPRVAGNIGFLDEAFTQLFDNACRFSAGRGAVSARAGISSGQVWVEIEDEGQGIPEDQQPFIFNTFWRQDEAHTTHGFGIGLSIVKKVVERHQGEISLSSREGKGTIIRLTLPALQQNAPTLHSE